MYKIMIVDDNSVQLEYVTTLLQSSSIPISEIKTANSGRSGLSLYQEFHPDIIISDVFMSPMSGIEMTKEIRKTDEEVAIIFISAHDNFEYIKEAMTHHAVTYILKPLRANEFEESIRQAAKRLEEKRHAKKLSEEILTALHESYLYSIWISPEAAQDKRFRYLLLENYKSFAALSFEIKSVKSPALSEIRIFDLLLHIKSEFPTDTQSTAVILSDDKILVLVCTKNEENFSNIILNFAVRVLQHPEHSQIIYVGISNFGTDPSEIYDLLKQANCALENKFMPILENIFLYDDIELEDSEYSIDELIQQLENLFNSSPQCDTHLFVDKFFPENESSSLQVKRFCFAFMSALQEILLRRNYDSNDIYGVFPWNKLNDFNSIPNPKQWIQNMLRAVLEFIGGNESNKYVSITNDIKTYIENNYSTITSVKDVVKGLYISTSYAKSIFKKTTGETIFDYLLHVRMEAAKKLLSNPYVKIYEVSEQVGYKTKDYFTICFKRYTGMTPHEFQINNTEN